MEGKYFCCESVRYTENSLRLQKKVEVKVLTEIFKKFKILWFFLLDIKSEERKIKKTKFKTFRLMDKIEKTLISNL